ncbi:MAG: hypothetical protein CL724_06810 [Chloroflexi bacterium]|nr:hypothetical protein [Chloroflexota bacterium]|tara:strand:+ start:1453 stop:1686 length:234 start_codon:yes stop_codon:yes gene_type:complete
MIAGGPVRAAAELGAGAVVPVAGVGLGSADSEPPQAEKTNADAVRKIRSKDFAATERPCFDHYAELLLKVEREPVPM